MHEFSITEHLLKDCIREAQAQNASKIRVIRLCIGALRGIVPDCIQIYLDMLAEGTIAEGAHIESETLPIRVRCLDCGREGEITPHHLECPHCQSLHLKLLSGKEFYIKSLEIDIKQNTNEITQEANIHGNKSTAPGHGLE